MTFILFHSLYFIDFLHSFLILILILGEKSYPQTFWLARRIAVLFVEKKTKICEEDNKLLKLNEVTRNKMKQFIHPHSVNFLKLN